MAAHRIRWGILGTGSIASQFTHDLKLLDEAEVAAVASRSQAGADAFADRFDIPRRHASYEALAADPDIDVVYIATPHGMHCANTILCLEGGKAVLCEKPMALNTPQCEHMIACARENNRFLMEAMWMRFFPAIRALRDRIAAGELGEICFLRADFCFHEPYSDESRLFDPNLGGGALLDVGIYPLALADFLFGAAPTRCASLAQLAPNGVDAQNAMALEYPGGALALLGSSFCADIPEEAAIGGTRGAAFLPARFFQADAFTIVHGGKREEHRFERIGLGFAYEAIEVMRCLREGLVESPGMPWAATLRLAETMDRLRADWGVHYPGEPQAVP